MLTAKENYLRAARGGKPERVPVFPQDVNFYVPSVWDTDPETGRDFFGVLWIDEASGKMPDVIHPILSNVANWRDIVHFPDLSKLDWDAEVAKYKENYDPDKVDIAMIHACGPFLLPINMLGWEEGLASLYEEPEALEELVVAITDFLIDLAGYINKYFHPDIMFSGDDLAAANGPLISFEIWQRCYKPQFKRLVDAIHGFGALAEFHNCGNNQYLIEEFLSIGVDICQLPMPNAALEADKKRFGSRLVINGGWDRISEASKPGASEETVRKSAHTAIDTYGKDGGLIFWDGGIILSSDEAEKKMGWLYDEVEKYGEKVYQS